MTALWWVRFPDRASARRAVARSQHPDLGGDAAEFIDAMASIDRRVGGAAAGPTPRAKVVVTRSRRGALRSWTRSVRRRYRRARYWLPGRRRRQLVL